MARPPLVSVVMPVYRVERYVEFAVRSVLEQSFGDLELIVVDDASPDGSIERVCAVADRRVQILTHPVNRGLAQARNTGLEAARGRYVALLDSDDIAPPDRFVRQTDFLQAHPEVVMCGGAMRHIDVRNRAFGPMHVPAREASDVDARLYFGNALFVSSLAWRRDALQGLRYDAGFRMAEDYDFNERACARGALANLSTCLLRYRVHPSSLTSTRGDEMEACVRRIVSRRLATLGVTPSIRQLEIHRHLERLNLAPSAELLDEIEAWLQTLEAATSSHAPVRAHALRRHIARLWFEACSHASSLGPSAWRRWRGSARSRAVDVPQPRIAKFAIKTALRLDRRMWNGPRAVPTKS